MTTQSSQAMPGALNPKVTQPTLGRRVPSGVKKWAYDAGKVLIGEKWEDPTLKRPILRALPRGWELSLNEAPSNPLSELGDTLIGLVCVLIGIVALGQIVGLL